jgi:anti-sigma factor RsiW
MRCLGNEDWLNRYLDGELDPSVQARLEEHLAVCEACQRELAQTRVVFASLESLQAVPVPAGFTDDVLAGLPRQSASPVAWGVLAAQVIASVILLALALPTLKAWYQQASVWLAPGWLSESVSTVMLAAGEVWTQFTLALTPNIELTWPQGFGLTWPQAAVMALALGGFWVLGNRLLLVTERNGTGGTT